MRTRSPENLIPRRGTPEDAMRSATIVLMLGAAWPMYCLLAGNGPADEIGPPRKIGLEQRVPWTTSRITGSLEAPPPFRTERIFPELSFIEPVTIATVP